MKLEIDTLKQVFMRIALENEVKNMANKQQNSQVKKEKVFRYGIRKFKSGAASVAVASGLLMLGTPVVKAQEADAVSVEVVGEGLPSEESVGQPVGALSEELAPVALEPVEALPEPIVADGLRSAVPLEFNEEGELTLTDDVVAVPQPLAEPRVAEEPVEPAPVQPEIVAEQTAPLVETVNRDVYLFTQEAVDAKVATVESASPVEVSVHQVIGGAAGQEMALPGLEATTDGRLVGQFDVPGIHRRQLAYTNEAGTSRTDTITIHAVEIQVARWARFLDATITPEQVLRNIVINRGNDTTLSLDQISKRVVTPLSDFLSTTDRIDVEIGLPNGVTKTVDVTPIINRKPITDAIDAAARDKRLALSSSTELTTEEKASLRTLIERERQQAVANIETVSLSGLKNEQTKGLANLAAVSLVSPIKMDARQNLARLVKEKKLELSNRTDLTAAAKQTAQTQLEREASKLHNAISKSRTNAEVSLVKDKSTSVIKEFNPVADLLPTPVPTASVAQPSSADQTITIINDIARDKRLALSASRDLTTEEKAAARQAIERARQTALANPSSAQELEALKAISLASAVKADARQTVARLVEEKTAELKARRDLTTAAKQTAQAQLEREAAKLRDAIDKSRTNAEVVLVKRKSSESVALINPSADVVATPVVATPASSVAQPTPSSPDDQALVAVINEAARDKRLALSSSRDLTTEEKAAARQTIERARQAALANLGSAKELEALKAISLASAVKADARQQLSRLLEQKTQELNARLDLSVADKQTAQALLDREVVKLRDAIDKSRTNAEVVLVKRRLNDVLSGLNLV